MRRLLFRSDILPFMIATVGEWIALYYWLDFNLRSAALLGHLVLWAGFILERSAVLYWVRTVFNPASGIANIDYPFWQQALRIIAVTITEVAIWIVWLWLASELGHVAAGVALFLLMQVEHSWEMSLVKSTSIWTYMRNGRTLTFTLAETLAGSLWLYYVLEGQHFTGGLILFVGLAVEHVIQGGSLKPSRERPSAT